MDLDSIRYIFVHINLIKVVNVENHLLECCFKQQKKMILNLKKCVVIGDRWTDMLTAQEVGYSKILVMTGAGEAAFKKFKNQVYYGKYAEVYPEYIAANFKDAVDWIRSNVE